MSSIRISPNQREVISAISTITGLQEYLKSTGGALNVAVTSGSGGAVTIADGADVAEGTTTDAAVTAGSAGTISGKLRQISADISTSNGLMATSANQTNGTQQTKITDGTNVAGVLKADGTIASTQNATITAGTGYSTATLTLNAGSPATAWFDMLNYSWVSVSILTNTTPATLTFQTAGDSSQTNAVSVNLLSPSGTATASTSTSATATFHGPRSGRYFRISSNVAGGNTATLVISFYTNAAVIQAATASQGGTWTVGSNSATGSAIPANAFSIGGSDGTNLRSISVSSTGVQDVGLMPVRTALNTYSVRVTTNTTNTPTASTAYISSISISSEATGTTSTVTIQDKQGTPLKLVNGFSTTALTTTPTVVNFQTPVKMTSGIDVITAGAVAATVDVWINYYQ